LLRAYCANPQRTCYFFSSFFVSWVEKAYQKKKDLQYLKEIDFVANTAEEILLSLMLC